MKIPKTLWILLLWLSVIVLFFAYHAMLDKSSLEIWVKPLPVDPHDMFRGEYIQLQYDFSLFHKDKLHKNDLKPEKASTIIYAVLKEEEELYVLDYFTFLRPPSKLVFLKGSFRGRFYEEELYDGANIYYNLESWFVPEGQGPILEQNIGKTLKAKLRVNPWGWARIVEISTEDLRR